MSLNQRTILSLVNCTGDYSETFDVAVQLILKDYHAKPIQHTGISN